MNTHCAGQRCPRRLACATHMLPAHTLDQFKVDGCGKYQPLTGSQAASLTHADRLRADRLAHSGLGKALLRVVS